MTTYSKMTLETILSENADYSNPYFKTKSAAYELTPDEAIIKRIELPSLSDGANPLYSAIVHHAAQNDTTDEGIQTEQCLAIRNTDTTNSVTVVGYTRMGDKVSTGGVVTVANTALGSTNMVTLTAGSGTPWSDAAGFGSNQHLFVVDAGAANTARSGARYGLVARDSTAVIHINSSSAWSAGSSQSLEVQVLRQWVHTIPAGGFFVLADALPRAASSNVDDAGVVYGYSNGSSGVSVVEVIQLGT
tara:strand:+ start:1720 stop:2457 length:738 start_codon:yes stop_codon:yes gene_type:complete